MLCNVLYGSSVNARLRRPVKDEALPEQLDGTLSFGCVDVDLQRYLFRETPVVGGVPAADHIRVAVHQLVGDNEWVVGPRAFARLNRDKVVLVPVEPEDASFLLQLVERVRQLLPVREMVSDVFTREIVLLPELEVGDELDFLFGKGLHSLTPKSYYLRF